MDIGWLIGIGGSLVAVVFVWAADHFSPQRIRAKLGDEIDE